MARTSSMSPSEALDAAQRAIGYNRPDGQITANNRNSVKAWLVAEGIPSAYVSTLSLDAMRAVWRDTTNTTLSAARQMAKSAPQMTLVDELDEDDDQDDQDGNRFAPQPAADPDKAAKASKALADALALITGLAQPQAAKLDEGRVIELVKQHAPKPETSLCRVEVKIPNRPEIKKDAKPRHKCFEEVLGALADGLNVLLVGPAGSGKTHLAEQCAEALDMPFAFTGAIASEYKLLGFKNAAGEYCRTTYRDAYENGGLYLWDEMDGSSPAALLPFNAGLANGHQDFPDRVIKRHADFRCIASANTYGNGADRQYVGRNQLDAASLDRFYVVPMDYDEKLERTIFGDGEWTTYVHKVRAAVRYLNIRHVVSMRAIDMGQRRLASGADRAQVERAVLWKHLSDADVTKIKGAM